MPMPPSSELNVQISNFVTSTFAETLMKDSPHLFLFFGINYLYLYFKYYLANYFTTSASKVHLNFENLFLELNKNSDSLFSAATYYSVISFYHHSFRYYPTFDSRFSSFSIKSELKTNFYWNFKLTADGLCTMQLSPSQFVAFLSLDSSKDKVHYLFKKFSFFYIFYLS